MFAPAASKIGHAGSQRAFETTGLAAGGQAERLQKLSADGVPAEVISDTHYPAGCVDRQAMTQDMASVIRLGPAVPGEYAFVIHPAAIPSGSKLLLDVTRLTTVTSGGTTTTGGGVGDRLWALGAGSKDFSVGAGMGLVYDSGNC